MGLDMYLKGEKYYSKYEDGGTEIIEKLKEVTGYDVKSVIIDIGYWRKANHIHKWFVNNVQSGEDDCKEYKVSLEKLETLLNLCNTVLDKAVLKEVKDTDRYKLIIENYEDIEELLPTESGFFFGSTNYDEYYIEEIKDTIRILNKAIKMYNKGSYIYYRSSW